MAEKFIPYKDLSAWLTELAADYAVFAPQKKGTAAVYSRWNDEIDPSIRLRPTESAKKAVFPRAEELFRFHYAKDAEAGSPEGGGLGRLVVSEAPEPRPVLIFGILPCDARGFLAFDPVYSGSGTNGQAQDTYYLRRREKAVLIARACKTALSTCFCSSVGGDPADKSAADVLCTDVEGGLILEPLTDKGRAVLTSALLKDADSAACAAAAAAHEAVRSQLPASVWTTGSLDNAQSSLTSLFDDEDFWKKHSSPCLSCGACTYLCPTCYCFNITDENSGNAGVRLRSWDNCMSFQFTQEASGHNPRAKKFQRLRNRVSHKFAYYPGLHQGRVACTGCGRCIKSCPSSVDIRAIVKDALNAGNISQNTTPTSSGEE